MKKLYFFTLIGIAVIGVYFLSSGNQNKEAAFGDVDATAADEDGAGRVQYEMMMLADPATGKIPEHIREKELAFASLLPKEIDGAAYKTSVASWQSRGPWNVGGRTRAFAIDVTNENNLLAGSTSGGMWRSTDGGVSWSTTTPVNSYQSVSAVVQDTRSGKTNTWYYATGEGYGASASGSGAYYLGNGIYKSTDGGITWNVLPSTTSANLTSFDVWADIVWNIATDPSDLTNDVVIAAAYGGIYRSADGGTTWTLVRGSTQSPSYFTDIAITSTGVVYVTLSSDGSARGIFRSTDGINYTNITPANFPSTYNRIKIGVSPSDENQVYFLGETPGAGYPDTNYLGSVEWNSLWKYKYLSGDGTGTGGIWQDFSNNLPHTGGQFDKYSSQTSYDIVVKVKPNDTNTVFIGGTNLYRSTSGFSDDTHTTFIGGYVEGATLPVVLPYLNHHPDQHELVFLPSDPNKMISTNDGGIFKTNDNTANTVVWNSLNNGYMTTMFYTCAIDHASTNDIIIGGAQDNGSWFTNSANLNTPWVTPRGGDGSYCAIADNQAAYYFSIQSGRMMRAKLNASGGIDSFARIDPIGVATTNYLFINPFIIDPNNNNIMYMAGGNFLWRNNNLAGIPYASNWDSISTNWVKLPDSVGTSTIQISAIAAAKTPANRIYYGTSAKKVYRLDNANSSNPIRTEITSTALPYPFPTGYVSSIAVDPTNGDHVMVTFSNYGIYSIYYSADAGATWQKIAGNLEASSSGGGNGPSVRWGSIIPVNGGTVYMVGTSVGLFATTSLNGLNTVWTQQSANGIGSAVVDMIDFRATDGTTVVATHSHGIFSTKITDIGDILDVKDIQNNASIQVQAYPNPFYTQTNIRFTLTKNETVSIILYDELGRVVRQIANGNMTVGEKTFTISATGLRSGIYYCTVKTNHSSNTTKIILM